MTQLDTILSHLQLCDEIHQCAVDENRWLRQHEQAPGAEFIERKRDLLRRLDASLTALRKIPASSVREPECRQHLDSARGRILQVIQLDRENEQLLLRCSLRGTRAPGTAATTPISAPGMLQKIYARRA